MKVDYSSTFQRAYKKRIQGKAELEARFAERLDRFMTNPRDPSLHVHRLSHDMMGLLAFKIDYDCRVVFEYIDSERVLFVDVGTHDQVY